MVTIGAELPKLSQK